jgi:hypothetical protein
LIDTEASKQCMATDTSAGKWFTIAGWVVQVLGWAFAALFVAGFAGAVRRPG